MRSPIFILGLQRSGTTLLVSMLDENPEVNMLPSETHFYILLWKQFGYKKVLAKTLKDYCLTVLPQVNKGWTIEEYRINLSRILAHIDDKEIIQLSPNTIIDKFFHSWTDTAQYHTGEKTPAHIFYLRDIIKKYPNAKFVALVRDPRAAMLSEIVKLDNNKEALVKFNLFNFIFRTQCVFDLIDKWKKNYPDNFMVCRYEDIISTPEITVQQICKFIGITYLPTMLEVGVKNSSFGDENQKGITFNAANTERWKVLLNDNQIANTEYFLGSSMNKYEYAISGSNKEKPALKHRLIYAIGRKLNFTFPALFHHLNRQKKYKINSPDKLL
jgi:hypothetical protein